MAVWILIVVWVLSFIWTISQARIDSDHYKKNQFVTDHVPRFISRFLVGCMVAAFSWQAGLIVGLVFWTFFDGSLSMFRGLNFWYLGRIPEIQSLSQTDLFFQKHKWLYVLTKISALAASIIIILI